MSHPLLARLRSGDAAERRAACTEIPADPSAVLLLEALVETLGDADRGVARAASDAIVATAARAPEASALLKGALRGDDPRRRWGAAFTTARLAPPEPGLLPVLAEAMGSADGDVRWAAARLLVETGRLHPEVLGVAIGLARAAESPVVRRMALFCLRELAPDDPHAADALLEASLENDATLRRAALTALAALLDPPARVERRLIEALSSDGDPIARRIAAIALGELAERHPERRTDALRERLRAERARSDDRDLQRALDRALAGADARSRTHAPEPTGGDPRHE